MISQILSNDSGVGPDMGSRLPVPLPGHLPASHPPPRDPATPRLGAPCTAPGGRQGARRPAATWRACAPRPSPRRRESRSHVPRGPGPTAADQDRGGRLRWVTSASAPTGRRGRAFVRREGGLGLGRRTCSLAPSRVASGRVGGGGACPCRAPRRGGSGLRPCVCVRGVWSRRRPVGGRGDRTLVRQP